MKKLSHMLAESINDVEIPTHRKYVGNMDDFLDSTDFAIMSLIKKAKIPFIQPVPVKIQKDYLGWKYTIVANNLPDFLWLYVQIGSYLRRINVPFKVGTVKLLSSANKEQSVKCITIYICKDTKADLLFDDLKYFLKEYNPNIKLKYSEHAWGPIWKRTDRDEFGNYIPADQSRR